MKKSITVLLAALIVLSLAGPAYCNGPEYYDGPLHKLARGISNIITRPIHKLGRGICNIITCPMEIPNRIDKTYSSSGRREAYTYGAIQGIVMMGFRMAVGMIEIATFPIPLPQKYEPILNDPEFFMDFSREKKDNK